MCFGKKDFRMVQSFIYNGLIISLRSLYLILIGTAFKEIPWLCVRVNTTVGHSIGKKFLISN